MKLKTLLVTLITCLITTLSSVNAAEIEEVIVIAEKRSESLQDVSQSVTAITSSELDVKNITDFVGLSSVAPGVTVAKNEGYKTVISIRGVGDETNQNAKEQNEIVHMRFRSKLSLHFCYLLLFLIFSDFYN